MDERALYDGLLWAYAVLGAVVFAVLLRVPAGYGRHARSGWGPTVPARAGWILMESPAALGMAGLFVAGGRFDRPAAWAFLAPWLLHYGYRAFVYPFRLRAPRPMPLLVAAMGLLFNLGNAWLNGRWLFTLDDPRPAAWLADPRFLGGLALFLLGFRLNLRADAILRSLRRVGAAPGAYAIPAGGPYRWVSCPNYLGELLEWLGWALLTWSPGGLAFALWTAANLVPRALAHHRWYRATFPDYPPDRKALIPYVL